MNPVPIPHDIPLPYPLPVPLLHILIVVSFLLHILFVNLMLGGTLLVFVYQLRGRFKKDYDRLARDIAMTVTVNKSLAVVLGVAPLLIINTLYTVYFYSANALTGYAWIMIVPLVTLAFLMLYLHKYTWDSLANHRMLHIGILSIPLAIFLMVPLIFLANINLMLFPEHWGDVKGFFSSLLYGNVFPRYFHFIAASIAATGLFLVGYIGRESYPFAKRYPNLNREGLLKEFYSYAFGVTCLQFLIGPLVFITLPAKGLSLKMAMAILVGASLGIPTLWLMWEEIEGRTEKVGEHFSKIVTLFATIVLLMGTGRHLYRETAVSDHRVQMLKKTEEFVTRSKAAMAEKLENTPRGQSLDFTPPGKPEEKSATPFQLVLALNPNSEEIQKRNGKKLFQNYCAVCHQVDGTGSGPMNARNLTIPEGWKQGTKLTDIFRTLTEGVPGTSMVSFSNISPWERFAISHYVQELGKFEHGKVSKAVEYHGEWELDSSLTPFSSQS